MFELESILMTVDIGVQDQFGSNVNVDLIYDLGTLFKRYRRCWRAPS